MNTPYNVRSHSLFNVYKIGETTSKDEIRVKRKFIGVDLVQGAQKRIFKCQQSV